VTIGFAGTEVCFVRSPRIRVLFLAAIRMNGWSSRCGAAPDFTLTQHFASWERTPHEFKVSTMGSLQTLAAQGTDV